MYEEGQEKYVFISYCHEDSDSVFPIIEKLERVGTRLWYDEGNHKYAGREWSEIIESRIINADCFISFMSKNAVISENCRDEIYLAKKYLPKSMITIFINGDETLLKGGLELQLIKSHMLKPDHYRTANGLLELLLNNSKIIKCKTPELGSIIQFGNYPLLGRDIHYSEKRNWISDITDRKINWKVLSIDDNSYFVLCNEIIGFSNYYDLHAENNDLHHMPNWKWSIIRDWLNTEFYWKCFSENERKLILPKLIKSSTQLLDNNYYSYSERKKRSAINKGRNIISTTDFIYLLNEDEFFQYCSSENKNELICPALSYKEYQPFYDLYSFWLRDANYKNKLVFNQEVASVITLEKGEISVNAPCYDIYSIRPALNIKL